MSPHLPSLALTHHDLTLSECDELQRLRRGRVAVLVGGGFRIRGSNQPLNQRIVTRLVRMGLMTLAGGMTIPTTLVLTPEGETFARAVFAQAMAA